MRESPTVARELAATPPGAWSRQPELLADLLRQLNDDPLRAADVAEPVAVLVALQLADELSAAGSQIGDDGVDVLDGECDMADTRCVRLRVPVVALVRRRAPVSGTGSQRQTLRNAADRQ
jgi:hypothetical protein